MLKNLLKLSRNQNKNAARFSLILARKNNHFPFILFLKMAIYAQQNHLLTLKILKIFSGASSI